MRRPASATESGSGGGPGTDGRATSRFFRPVVIVTAGAVLLRLLLLLGRGDYLAFDEGWYLLLARGLFTDDGYSLVGFPHTALSPLFPILAGALGAALDSWVWGGRIVAAVASGLVVLPAWAVFRRLATDRTALIGAALVAVLPSLAPFVAPFWIGADLWVGAEPLLHLFLYTGIALWLAADHEESEPRAPARPLRAPLRWFGSGAGFGLAFLARPEAIITWGLLGLVSLGLAAATRSPRRLYGAALMGVGFALLVSPYWLYIHEVSGQWRLTGRGVSLPSVTVQGEAGAVRSGSARTIERMLWHDDESYRQRLYGLDASGLRLRSDYWGVEPVGPGIGAQGPGAANGGSRTEDGGPGAAARRAAAGVRGQARGPGAEPPSTAHLYLRAMGMVLPILLWLFVLIGVIQPRSLAVLRRELPVTGALLGTSLAVAGVVAVDPRTQLFLAPLLALYAARGFALAEETLGAGGRAPAGLRPGFVELLLAGTALLWLLGINARRLYLSVALGSPHHVVAEQNRAVAEELDSLLADDTGPIASWHPALAVYADRDWRVLPFGDLAGIVRYLDTAGAEAMVLSAYYPPDLGVEDLNTRYLVVPVPDTDGERQPWRLRLTRGDTIRAVGVLEPVGPEPVAPGGP